MNDDVFPVRIKSLRLEAFYAIDNQIYGLSANDFGASTRRNSKREQRWWRWNGINDPPVTAAPTGNDLRFSMNAASVVENGPALARNCPTFLVETHGRRSLDCAVQIGEDRQMYDVGAHERGSKRQVI